MAQPSANSPCQFPPLTPLDNSPCSESPLLTWNSLLSVWCDPCPPWSQVACKLTSPSPFHFPAPTVPPIQLCALLRRHHNTDFIQSGTCTTFYLTKFIFSLKAKLFVFSLQSLFIFPDKVLFFMEPKKHCSKKPVVTLLPSSLIYEINSTQDNFYQLEEIKKIFPKSTKSSSLRTEDYFYFFKVNIIVLFMISLYSFLTTHIFLRVKLIFRVQGKCRSLLSERKVLHSLTKVYFSL